MSRKCVVVTGASSGIGAATAKAYGAAGAHLILLARSESGLAKTATCVREAGGTATAIPVDLADPDAAAKAAQDILAEAAPDVLINNAGAGAWRPFLDTSAEAAQAMISVPYLAAFNLTRALLPAMLARRSGRIALISSPGAYFAWPNAAAYIASRHAVRGLAEALCTELHRKPVTVTLVVLGTVESPYWQHNPGSRENLPAASPALLPILSVDQAAQAIMQGTERGARLVVKPALYRPLFLLSALFPSLVASQIRKSTKRAHIAKR